jgi:hypothetical protein
MICHVNKWGKSADGGGSSACFIRNERTFVRNGSPEKLSSDDGKLWKSAVTFLFNRFNGFSPVTIMMRGENERVVKLGWCVK